MYRLVATVICISLSCGSSYLSPCETQRMRSCLDVPVVANFNVERYVGTWFEQEKFPFPEEEGFKCNQATYSLNKDGSVKVINSGQSVANANIVSFKGKATAGSNPAKLKVTFTTGQAGKYWVLDTDYVNYSVVWSCTDTDVGPRAIAWILSRKREVLCPKLVEKLKDKLCQYRIDTSRFEKTDQTNCEQEWYG